MFHVWFELGVWEVLTTTCGCQRLQGSQFGDTETDSRAKPKAHHVIIEDKSNLNNFLSSLSECHVVDV